MPSIRETFGENEFYFQQDGTPPHYPHNVRLFLDEILPNRWIEWKGFIEHPPHLPDLTPLDFFYGDI